MTPSEEKHRLVFLDGLRGWAAFMVLCSHLMPYFLGYIYPAYENRPYHFLYDGRLAICCCPLITGQSLLV
jgi:peptidoglycan/LPS O-acetylase OafA/YrhL